MDLLPGWSLSGYLLSPSLHIKRCKKSCLKSQTNVSPGWQLWNSYSQSVIRFYLLCGLQGYYVQGSLWIFILKGILYCPQCHMFLYQSPFPALSHARCVPITCGGGVTRNAVHVRLSTRTPLWIRRTGQWVTAGMRITSIPSSLCITESSYCTP